MSVQSEPRHSLTMLRMEADGAMPGWYERPVP